MDSTELTIQRAIKAYIPLNMSYSLYITDFCNVWESACNNGVCILQNIDVFTTKPKLLTILTSVDVK